jgi:acyl-CoA synthetase (AMP-forming)/AMP-acid ligase II
MSRVAFTTWNEVCTVGDLLVRSAARFPDRRALVMPGMSMTYAELLDEAAGIARSIVGLGVAPRSHVGLFCNNGRELVTGMFAAMLANCVAVPLHTRHKAHELRYIIDNAELSLLLSAAADTSYIDFRKAIAEALPSVAVAGGGTLSLPEAPSLRHIALLSGEAAQGFIGPETFARAGDSIRMDNIDALRLRTLLSETAMIIYTSGTTANPKGCMLSHEAMTRGPVERANVRFRSSDHDVTWGGGPLFHIGTLSPFLGVIGTAGTYICDTFFDPARAIALMKREQPTAFWPWFPAILQPLMDHEDFDEATCSVRAMLLIAPEAMVRRVQQRLPHAEIMQACGMTETAGIFALSTPDETDDERARTQGKAVPGIEVRIIDPETGEDSPHDQVGEILVRGFCVTSGYWRAPEKTAEAIDADGWLHTGDLYALSADGSLTFNGRVKDMLKVGGENVAAVEIEAFLCTHGAVRLAEVVGRPDDRLDEVPVAFVELQPGAAASEQELIEHCRGRIASYKVPRAIYFVQPDEWPMSATKIDKVELRRRVPR